MLRRPLALLGGVAAIVSLLAASPAQASTSRRIVPLGGSANYLVYGEYRAGGNALAPREVELYSRARSGLTTSLGEITTRTPTKIHASVAGSVLVVALSDSNIRWDLTTGAKTTITSLALAGPGGYVSGFQAGSGATARDHVSLVESGSTGDDHPVVDLGVPFPNNENVDGSIGLSSGTPGVVANDNNGHTRYLAFATPGQVTNLHTYEHGVNDADVECGQFTTQSVACIGYFSGRRTAMGFQLDRSAFVYSDHHCVSAPAALATAIAWVGCHGRLEVLHKNSSITTSTEAFGTVPPVSAYGKVILQSASGTKLQAMSRAGSRPVTIAAV